MILHPRSSRNIATNACKKGAMIPYIKAGFTTFDMADHYGSSEIIAGICKNNSDENERVKLLTKWVLLIFPKWEHTHDRGTHSNSTEILRVPVFPYQNESSLKLLGIYTIFL